MCLAIIGPIALTDTQFRIGTPQVNIYIHIYMMTYTIVPLYIPLILCCYQLLLSGRAINEWSPANRDHVTHCEKVEMFFLFYYSVACDSDQCTDE